MGSPSKYSKEEIEEAFRAEMPYFYELQNKLQTIENGQIQLTVRKYKGTVQDYVITVSEKKKVN